MQLGAVVGALHVKNSLAQIRDLRVNGSVIAETSEDHELLALREAVQKPDDLPPPLSKFVGHPSQYHAEVTALANIRWWRRGSGKPVSVRRLGGERPTPGEVALSLILAATQQNSISSSVGYATRAPECFSRHLGPGPRM